MHKASLYEKLDGNKLKCLSCSHYCKISPGQTGICQVRKNKEGELYLLVYGKSVSANIDPIEKKPLFHFLPGSDIFSIGTLGCNFQCSFCQNYDISQMPRIIRDRLARENKLVNLDTEISSLGYDLPPEQIVKYCVENKILSIAYTYNEPSIFFEYTYDTSKLAHENGLKNVYVSNGYASIEAIDKIAPYLDAINVDLKAFSEGFYQKICKAKLQPVLDNIRYYYEKGIWIEITTLLIPGENDSEDEITKCAEFIASISDTIPWHISRFYPAYKMKDKEATSEESLMRAFEIGKKSGLKYVYVGNVFNEKHQSTFCHKCGSLLIKRNWGSCKIVGLEDGKCMKCHCKIEGIW